MHSEVFYFSVCERRRRDFYDWVERNQYDVSADFQIVGKAFSCRSSKDLLLFLDENKQTAKTLFVIVDFLPFFLKPGHENAAKDVRHAILGYPEVFFLFDETSTMREDFKVFLYQEVGVDVLKSVLSDYHVFTRESQADHYVNGAREKNPFEALYRKRSNLFDGSNLRYSLKMEEYEHLHAAKNFHRIQQSRFSNLAICVEEERTQNRFDSFAAFANGFRVLPVLSAEELKWVNEYHGNDLKVIIRDYDLQFFDVYEADGTIMERKEHDYNLVDYIRGAKYDETKDPDGNCKGWIVLEEKDNNVFWNKMKGIHRVFVSKGTTHLKTYTNKFKLARHRKDLRWVDALSGQNQAVGAFEEASKDLQFVRGFRKPVAGIYSSFHKIEILGERFQEGVSWRRREHDKDYVIDSTRKGHDHGVPLDIYELTKSMTDRARWYYAQGKFVIASVIAWDVLEILNGFHQSLMMKAYHIYAISENAVCMNILGGNEAWLKEDATIRIQRIRDDVSRLFAVDKKERDTRGLQVNILNQIFSDCRNFCKEKEHFLSEEAFISAMGHTNDGIRIV